jgi:23S rRNA (uracil1939-C5)-methyltransferase
LISASSKKLTFSSLLIDIYSGIGTIGLTLARDVKQVIGIEVVADAVQDALYNSHLNGIS